MDRDNHEWASSSEPVDPRQARWVQGVLSLLIDVLGERSTLGVILRQASNEIGSLSEEADWLADDDRRVA